MEYINGYKIVTKEQTLEKVNNALKTIGKAYESSQDEGEEDDMVMFILARENIERSDIFKICLLMFMIIIVQCLFYFVKCLIL